jgi:hypothetical protein
MNEPANVPLLTQSYECPCCGQGYEARITVAVGVGTHKSAHTPQGELMEMCSICHEPCCPRCVCIFGEGRLVCTRCTTNRNCVHDGSSMGG